MENNETETLGHIRCKSCGGDLKYAPGTSSLQCSYCGTTNQIEVAEEESAEVKEHDFEAMIREMASVSETEEQHAAKCNACGATTTLPPNVTSANCPFCDTALVVAATATARFIKPHYVLPFAIDNKQAHAKFKDWLKGLWFAPNDLKKFGDYADRLKGMYIPYWTFDAETDTDYTGMRGDAYYVTETYTTTENGQSVQRTRQVRHIRWSSAYGNVHDSFDDILVMAAHSLPLNIIEKLEPWDLHNLVPFNDQYLSGFQSEVYSVNLENGFGNAKGKMEAFIRQSVCRDIGGDEQRISTMDTEYNQVTFKHILLPLYISAYRYNDKVYRFLINARTGEVQGERPYSAWKIALAVIGGLLLILLLFLLFQGGF